MYDHQTLKSKNEDTIERLLSASFSSLKYNLHIIDKDDKFSMMTFQKDQRNKMIHYIKSIYEEMSRISLELIIRKDNTNIKNSFKCEVNFNQLRDVSEVIGIDLSIEIMFRSLLEEIENYS